MFMYLCMPLCLCVCFSFLFSKYSLYLYYQRTIARMYVFVKRGARFETKFENVYCWLLIVKFHAYYWSRFFYDSGFYSLMSDNLVEFKLEYDYVNAYVSQYRIYHTNVNERRKKIVKILDVVRDIVSKCVETKPICKRTDSCPFFAHNSHFSSSIVGLESNLLSIRGNVVFPPYVPFTGNVVSVIDIFYKRLELDIVVDMSEAMESLCLNEGISDVYLGKGFVFCRTLFDFLR